MTIVVLLILAVLWAAMLVPPYLRNRAEARPADSIGAFRRQMSTISRTTPGAPTVPFMSMRRAAPPLPLPLSLSSASPVAAPVRRGAPSLKAQTQKRRRDVFLFLLAAMATSLLLSFLLPIMLVAHVAFDIAFVAYVALLIRMRNAAAERDMKVRFLPGAVGHGGGVEPLLLRRSAN